MKLLPLIGTCLFAALCAPARAELSAEELAKLAQNPVGNLISLPLQNSTNLNFGPNKGKQKSSTSSRCFRIPSTATVTCVPNL